MKLLSKGPRVPPFAPRPCQKEGELGRNPSLTSGSIGGKKGKISLTAAGKGTLSRSWEGRSRLLGCSCVEEKKDDIMEKEKKK